MSYLFSENLPLTPSGKIRETSTSHHAEQERLVRKTTPEEPDPKCEGVLETSYPTHCTYICMDAQGGYIICLSLCLSRSKRAFHLK